MYNLKIWRSIKKLDSFLLKIILVFLALLIASQFFLLFDFSRPYFSRLDKLEGDSILIEQAVTENVAIVKKSANIKVTMNEPQTNPRVFLTVNGQVVGNFASGYVATMVFDGDIVEIDAQLYPHSSIYIVEITDSASMLSKKEVIVNKSSICSLGVIQLKGD